MAAILANAQDGVVRTSGLRTSTEAYSICWWVEFASLPAPGFFNNFFYQGPDPALFSTWIWIGQFDDGSVAIDISGAPTYNSLTVAGKHHFAYVRASATDHKLYLDGVLFIASGVNSTPVTVTEQYLGTDVVSPWMPSQLAYAREWTVALTAAEINAERLSATVVKTANLLANAPLASDLLDISGNGNDWAESGGTIAFGAQPTLPTRLYPAVASPSTLIDEGGCAGTWARQSVYSRSWSPVQPTWRLTREKTNSGTQTQVTVATNQQGDFDLLWLRWMTPPGDVEVDIEGTLNFCFGAHANWVTAITFSADAAVRWKLHAYITVGESAAVRHTLIDNWIDGTDFNKSIVTSDPRWSSPTPGAISITSGTRLVGDCVMIELGFRIVSSPTPTPTYPPSDNTLIKVNATGANPAFADAVPSDGSTASRAPWFEFSTTFTDAALPAPPANDACVDATVITSLPFDSGFIDTTGSTETDKDIWFTWTAPADQVVMLQALGANYRINIDVLRNGCGTLTTTTSLGKSDRFAAPRSLSYTIFEAFEGVEYLFRVRQRVTTAADNAIQRGGICRFTAIVQDTAPQVDDLYLPNGWIVALREDQIVNYTPTWLPEAPTGVAIDYTRRPMDDLNGGVNTSVRLLFGLHDFNLVEIVDLPTLNLTGSEVDFIGLPWTAPVKTHPAQLYVTAAGYLYAGWFGNGYLYVVGVGTNKPAILNTVSSNADYSAVKAIDATSGDSQPGGPFTDTLHYPSIEVTAPWAITLDEATGILYYTSGGFYEPVGGQTIRRFNVYTNTQLSTFATLALQGVNNPGLKGLQFIPGGGVLVCNGTVVQRLDDTGAVIQTYTPSIAEDSQSLTDVKLTADGLRFWTIDEATGRLFRFDLATGVEDLTVQPYLLQGTLVQMAIYQPDGITPPPVFCPGTLGPPRTDGLPYVPTLHD